MQVGITWQGNPHGKFAPVVIAVATLVEVEVRDDSGGSLSGKTQLFASLVENGVRVALEPTRVENSTVSYRVSLRRRFHLLPTRFEVSAVGLESGTVESPAVRRVISESEDWVARAALAVLVLIALYTVLLVPQIEGALHWLKETEGIPVLSAISIGCAAAWRPIREWLRLPLVAVSGVLVSAIALGIARQHATFVVNHSLERLATGVGVLAPGEQGVIWDFSAPDATCTVKAEGDAKACIPLGEGDDFGFHLGSLLFLRREEAGCVSQPIPERDWASWRKLGHCVPPDGIVIDNASASQLQGKGSYTAPAHVVVKLQPSLASPTKELAMADTDSRWRLRFAEPTTGSDDGKKGRTVPIASHTGAAGQVSSGAPMALRLKMKGDDVWQSVDTVVPRAGSALTPFEHLRDATQATVLRADVQVGTLNVGELTSTLFGSAVDRSASDDRSREAPCWLVPTGTRLSGLVLRGAVGAAQWTSHASEFVTELPLCWTESTAPTSGELQLDRHWSATQDWTITLPANLVPSRLTVMDESGHSWGDVACDASGADWWTIGPLPLETPRSELSRLTTESCAWSAAEGRTPAKWFWGCWPYGHEPSKAWQAAGRWTVALGGRGKGYLARQGQLDCVIDMQGHDLDKDHCNQVTELTRKAWFDGHGQLRPECSPRSTVCQRKVSEESHAQ